MALSMNDEVLIIVTTLIGNHDNNIPKEGDLQDAPLHSNDNQDLL